MNISIPPQTIDPGCPRPDLARHDVYSSVRYGCTCRAAMEDKYRYQKRWRHGTNPPGRIDATGTCRRLQALLALGHSRAFLGECLGIHERGIGLHLNEKSVTRSFAERVVLVYDALSMTPGESERTRKHALRMGWAPPLGWDEETIDDPSAVPSGHATTKSIDELAVRLAVRGELGDRKLTRVEAQEAIRRMRKLGLPTKEIARRAHVSDRTVHRQGHEHTTAAA